MTDTQTDPAADPEKAPTKPVLQGLEHITGGYLVHLLVAGKTRGDVLDIDAAALGLPPGGSAFSLTPTTADSAALLPYADYVPLDHAVRIGVAVAPKSTDILSVMVVPA
jgi:hypothetical protein